MRKVLLFLCGVGLLAAAGCTPPTSNQNNAANNAADKNANGTVHVEQGSKTPPENVVTVSFPAAVELKPGGTVNAKVGLSIVDPYHVHANPATLKNLIATTLTVTPPAGVKVDAPVYPPGKSMKFSFDDQPLSVYAGQAEIGLRIHADGKQAAGPVSVPAKLRYQACDDTACYPPKTIDVNIPINVKQ
jgi:hypothetical protein